LNPEGLTSVTGKWAADFAGRLQKSGLTCHVLERKEWEIKMVIACLEITYSCIIYMNLLWFNVFFDDVFFDDVFFDDVFFDDVL
jgi:hypothetical protein